ncbi:MAG: acetyl-CoA C-acyltransferase family protein [Gammaproteobacteria bacterium]
MSKIQDVVILSGARTAVGTYGGSLKDTPPAQLAEVATRAAVERSGLAAEDIRHAVFGNIIHTEPRDMYLSRVASVNGGLPVETPAMTLNRLCGSGLQAIVSAAQLIMLGDTDTALAGGAESMSRSPYWNNSTRWGQRMGHAELTDAMLAALHDPFDDCHMGVTAENVAEQWGISREQQDALAVQSHQRAANAIAQGYFKEQITPVTIKSRRKSVSFDTDEHVRADVSPEDLAGLPAIFKKDGSVTAGNASGINDGAAAIVMASADYAEQKGLTPLGRLVAYAHAGVEPRLMGSGPIPAVRQVLQKTGLSVDDMDVIEANEAFAAQALAVAQELGFPPDKTNPNGSGISLGHPVGATGCIITVKALYELARIAGRYALVTMCIGGGQGIAAVFERPR